MLQKFLKNKNVIFTIQLLVTLLLTLNYYSTITRVPFHPDESTYIYMSNDFDRLLTDPLSLRYSTEPQPDSNQHYRLVDPPLTRYVIGAVLKISGQKSLSVDWAWGLSWIENLKRGAFPEEKSLLVSRIAVSCFFMITLLSIYKTGLYLHNPLTGLIGMLLVGTSALVLLHTRRAMEESLLLLGTSLGVWCFTKINQKPWLAGLAVVLAVNAKLSAAPLFFLGIAAIIIMDTIESVSWSKRFMNLILFTSILVIGTYLLNPVAWNHPMSVLQLAIQERNSLVAHQLTNLQKLNPLLVLEKPGIRIANLINHLFFSQPAALDIGNYLQELKPSIDDYLASPGTSLMRGLYGGFVLLVLTLFGIILMLVKLFLYRNNSNRFWMVFLLGFVFFFAAMVAAISLPFQRYVIPLLPFVYLFIAFGISQMISPNKKAPG
jgi:hypothetical protein